MKLQPGEHFAIKWVLRYGERYGYSNLLKHLQTAWARSMMESGMDEEGARKASGPGYSFDMWDDIMRNGAWDESGKRYQ